MGKLSKKYIKIYLKNERLKSKIIKIIFKLFYKKSDAILVNDEDFKKSIKLYFSNYLFTIN